MLQSLLVLGIVGIIIATIGACTGIAAATPLGFAPDICMKVCAIGAEVAFLGLIALEARQPRQ